MKEKDIVRFARPQNEDEKTALMVVREIRGDRVLVSDLRFSGSRFVPTSQFSAAELVVAFDRVVFATGK